jgi:hypothetical protein
MIAKMVATSRRLLLCAALIIVTSAAGVPAQSELVLSKEGSKEYHRAGCDVVKDGKNVLALTRAQATARGLTPHAACDPAQTPQKPESGATPAGPVYVYTDGGRYYHKKECAKLGKDPKKADLEEAGKKLWPCPTCKPPIRKRGR